MGWIDALLVWVPEVMGNELQDEFGVSQPWQRASGRGAAPGLKIS